MHRVINFCIFYLQRTGVDTTWVVSPPGLVRAITLDIVINIDRFNAKATGQFAASYILSVSSGIYGV